MFNNTEYQKIWRTKNIEKHKTYQILYRKSSSGIYVMTKYAAKIRNIKFNLVKEDFSEWYDKQEQKCYYCDRTVEEFKNDKGLNPTAYRLSIDRKNNNLGYQLDNIVLCCGRCNTIKSDFFYRTRNVKNRYCIKSNF
jgi:hypothetical protein